MKWIVAVLLWLMFSLQINAMTDLRLALGQKQILDMRYYCPDAEESSACRNPVTKLTPELSKLIVQHYIGGVILFAENIENAAQVRTLISDIQRVAKQAGLPPLFIAIDQEGGRVSRLPKSMSNAFSGNMAIGATYAKQGTQFATQINEAIAQQLTSLSINLNFAPTVDVNSNPENPVINVRSFGETPQIVSNLGRASVAALQSNGIIAAMKHFPGHGDTAIDSHTGLPNVSHSLETIKSVDLLPFAQAISAQDASTPEMIMTAHIQYPALDSTRLLTRDGARSIVPATLSKRILTDILRNELKFKGVIVTDAMDMAGIAHYMAPAEAMLTSFYAGVDIALIPFTIRTPSDIRAYDGVMQRVYAEITNNKTSQSSLPQQFRVPTLESIERSLARILELKRRYIRPQEDSEQLHRSVPTFDDLDLRLAQSAITLVKGHDHLPVNSDQDFVLVMPDKARCEAMQNALVKIKFRMAEYCFSLANQIDRDALKKAINKTNGLIVGDISPPHSMAEMGGMDDKIEWQNRADKFEQFEVIQFALAEAEKQQKFTTLVAFRAPYILERFGNNTDLAIAAFDYRVYADDNGRAQGVMFDAVAMVLAGQWEAQGTLPVSINQNR